MSAPSNRLRTAIIDDNYFVVSRLLKKYPDLLDNVDSSNGWSNLHYASFHNHFQIAELLLGLIHDRFISSINNCTLRNFSSQVTKNPDDSLYTQITDEDEIKLTFKKETVLHIACAGDSAATLLLLLSYFNVCQDQRDINGLTPSHICCIKGNSDCLAILLENKAYPNLQDNEGDTPLHKAFQFNNLKCIEFLIKYNADDQLFNNAGWKPADVAFDNNIIQKYNSLKSHPSTLASLENTQIEIPITKYASSKANKNNVSNISFLSPVNATFPTSDHQPRIKLPSIQSRKYSLSSMISDEYEYTNNGFGDQGDDLFLPISRSLSAASSRNSRASSPSSNGYKLSLRKTSNASQTPTTVPQISQQQPQAFPSQQVATPQQQDFSFSNNNRRYIQPVTNPSATTQLVSPRKGTIGSHSIANDSPNSKRSSLSSRTFRSNSQLSDVSPVKPDPQIIQQASDLQFIKSGCPTPRQLQLNSRSNTMYSLSSQAEEASSKLQDLKLKNVDRLKLDTKLGNIINNSSQENLIDSPTSMFYSGPKTPLMDNHSIHHNSMSNPNTPINSSDSSKISKLLSIPILSSRVRHNT